jgi:hypothetical protein
MEANTHCQGPFLRNKVSSAGDPPCRSIYHVHDVHLRMKHINRIFSPSQVSTSISACLATADCVLAKQNSNACGVTQDELTKRAGGDQAVELYRGNSASLKLLTLVQRRVFPAKNALPVL